MYLSLDVTAYRNDMTKLARLQFSVVGIPGSDAYFHLYTVECIGKVPKHIGSEERGDKNGEDFEFCRSFYRQLNLILHNPPAYPLRRLTAAEVIQRK
jgi:hypothetical protein